MPILLQRSRALSPNRPMNRPRSRVSTRLPCLRLPFWTTHSATLTNRHRKQYEAVSFNRADA